MLKLVGRNLLSNRKHKYWRYAKYSDAIKNHLEWIIENLENSKNGQISVRVNDITKEMGPNFSGRNCTLIFPGLRYALFEEGIILEIGKNKDIFKVRFANKYEQYIGIGNLIRRSMQKCRNKDLDTPPLEQGLRNTEKEIWDFIMECRLYWQFYTNRNDLFHNLKLENCPVLKTRI